jgi:hypothetical protein
MPLNARVTYRAQKKIRVEQSCLPFSALLNILELLQCLQCLKYNFRASVFMKWDNGVTDLANGGAGSAEKAVGLKG